MRYAHIFAWLVASSVLAASAAGQVVPEFNKLVHQRNDLYAQLASLSAEAEAPAGRRHAREVVGETKHVQNQLDMVERRLADLAAEHEMEVPRPPVPTFDEGYADAVAMAPPGMAQPVSAQQRVEFNKLIHQRNKLHRKLTRLDEEASGLMLRGENPVTVYADQVSLQDQLDLVQLRLAILSTRYGLPVPPLPGESAPSGRVAGPDDEASRNMEKAFARGRERALKKIRNDSDALLASLEFWAFLNN